MRVAPGPFIAFSSIQLCSINRSIQVLSQLMSDDKTLISFQHILSRWKDRQFERLSWRQRSLASSDASRSTQLCRSQIYPEKGDRSLNRMRKVWAKAPNALRIPWLRMARLGLRTHKCCLLGQVWRLCLLQLNMFVHVMKGHVQFYQEQYDQLRGLYWSFANKLLSFLMYLIDL